MKVKWTTITDDESTWPPNECYFCCDDGESYFRKGDTYVGIGHSGNAFLSRFKGNEWRPMPKPTKKQIKKGKIGVPVEAFIDMMCMAEIHRDQDIVKEMHERVNKYQPVSLPEKESPWKSVTIKPEAGTLVLLKNHHYKIDGRIFCYKYNNHFLFESIDDMAFSTWHEWMEIPE